MSGWIRRIATAAERPIIGLALAGADLGAAATSRSYRLFIAGASAPPGLIERLSPYAALRAARHAIARVPAYHEFVTSRQWVDDRRAGALEWLQSLPETDKDAYVRAYSTEDRCIDGRIPIAGTQIDESSGSSGIAYNWVRSSHELRQLHRNYDHYVRYVFGRDLLTINGFSMGAWATGTNVGEGLRANGMVKSTGPDIDKIERTMRFFGPRYRYLITGYPPFLKEFLDKTEAHGFPWGDYESAAIVGGEGMSESLRGYLQRRFTAVYSGYGASDLDIGVAGELPLTVWIRRHAEADPALHQDLFGDDPRLPMLFQYNPLDYFIETNQGGELVVTVNRLATLSPRIRYNVRDAGGVLSFEEMLRRLSAHGLDPVAEIAQTGPTPVFRLPFVFLRGRSDSTVSFMGANIYPEDIQQALFADASDAERLGSFVMELRESTPGDARPVIHVEVVGGAVDDASLRERLARRVVDHLLATNRDFRSAVEENPTTADVQVELHRPGAGPFAENVGRVKRRYILSHPVGDRPGA